MKYYLAIDIGASSGRHIVGWKENGALHTEEVYRFPNGNKEQDGHLVWDVKNLFEQVKRGIAEAVRRYGKIDSLSIDTWAVDYVLMNGEEEILPFRKGAEDGKALAFNDWLYTSAVKPGL